MAMNLRTWKKKQSDSTSILFILRRHDDRSTLLAVLVLWGSYPGITFPPCSKCINRKQEALEWGGGGGHKDVANFKGNSKMPRWGANNWFWVIKTISSRKSLKPCLEENKNFWQTISSDVCPNYLQNVLEGINLHVLYKNKLYIRVPLHYPYGVITCYSGVHM